LCNALVSGDTFMISTRSGWISTNTTVRFARRIFPIGRCRNMQNVIRGHTQ
jgi:hypothetical protein